MPVLDPPPIIDPALLVDVRAVAVLLNVSAKTVKRLADAGQIPPPLKLGHLRRWSKAAIESWIVESTAAATREGGGR